MLVYGRNVLNTPVAFANTETGPSQLYLCDNGCHVGKVVILERDH